MERIHRHSILLYTMKSGTTSAPARPFGQNDPVFAQETDPFNEANCPRGCNLSVFATAPLAYLFFVRLLAADQESEICFRNFAESGV
jgi:hypothetical protein